VHAHFDDRSVAVFFGKIACNISYVVHVALPLGGSVYGHLILFPCSSI
jgi:hypothetical protein